MFPYTVVFSGILWLLLTLQKFIPYIYSQNILSWQRKAISRSYYFDELYINPVYMEAISHIILKK